MINPTTNNTLDQKLPRLLYVIGCFGLGGSERQVSYIAQSIAKKGSCVKIVATSEDQNRKLLFTSVAQQSIDASKSTYKRIILLAKIIHSFQPDIIHSFLLIPSIFAFVARIVARSHAAWIPSIRFSNADAIPFLAKIFARYTLPFASVIECNSKRVANFVTRTFHVSPSKIVVTVNGVDTSIFIPAINREISPQIIVGTVGKDSSPKNVPLLFSIIKHFLNETTNISFLLIGYNDEIIDKYCRPPLNNNQKLRIRCIPWTNTVQIFMQQMDIFLLTSNYEGMPNAVMEAMATAIPVVTTDAGGVSEIIESGIDGFVTGLNDTKQICEKIKRLSVDLKLRTLIGHNARQKIVNYFSIDTLLSKSLNLYQNVLNSNRTLVQNRIIK